jgi:hypothetical protein
MSILQYSSTPPRHPIVDKEWDGKLNAPAFGTPSLTKEGGIQQGGIIPPLFFKEGVRESSEGKEWIK